MRHASCTCSGPNAKCPRFGWMKGHLWAECQSTSNPSRDRLLDIYEARHQGKPPPPLPSLVTQAANYAAAKIGHAFDWFANRTEEEVKACVEICAGCDQFTEGRCAKCGCPVEEKAAMRSEDCPVGKWPKSVGPVTHVPCGGCGR
jgi:Family of unknown function (DUF6171)